VLDLAAGCGQSPAPAWTQFAAFVSSARPPAAAPVAAAPAPQQASSTFGWLDDWTPEASGIFRIFRREPSRLPEMAADAGSPCRPRRSQSRAAGRRRLPQRQAPVLAFASED
jgi:Rieske Fe-S protein